MVQRDGKKAKVADLLVERLIDWGVKVVFGLPGDGRIALTLFRNKVHELIE